jgi:hypothetical protein
MMVGARVVFAEPGMDQCVIGRLVVDPQEEELLGLQFRLKLECCEFEGDSFFGEWFQLGHDHSGE